MQAYATRYTERGKKREGGKKDEGRRRAVFARSDFLRGEDVWIWDEGRGEEVARSV